MNIGFIKVTPQIENTSGVRIQAIEWKKGLESCGHQVLMINIWEDIDWTTIDMVIIFEYGGILKEWVLELKKLNVKILLAPIIDTNKSKFFFGLAARFLGSKSLKIRSKFNDLYSIVSLVDGFLVRSEYEKAFFTKSLGVNDNLVHIVRLPFRLKYKSEEYTKSNICLHVSRLASKNKNVSLLCKAAKKYKFHLVLAGMLNGEQEKQWLEELIEQSDGYVEYVGLLSDEQLSIYYQKAKVFALPSTFEGVGLVALEAALFGCEIVLTKNGGPKEYFKGMCTLVDPYDIDDIGKAVCCFLDGVLSYQPKLAEFIKEEYSPEKTIGTLSNIISQYK